MSRWLPWLAAFVAVGSGCGRTSQRCTDCGDGLVTNGGTGFAGSGGTSSSGATTIGGQAQGGIGPVQCNAPGPDSPLTRWSLVDLQWTLDAVLGEGESFPPDYELSRPNYYRSASHDFTQKLALIAEARAAAVAVDEATFELDSFVRGYGSRLYRRALSEEQVSGYVAQFEQQRQSRSVTESAHALLRSMLLSPYFVFRIELGGNVTAPLEQPNGAPLFRGTPLDTFEIAARLSHFTVRMAPDAELLQAAADGRLLQEGVLDAQYQRLRSSPAAARARMLHYLEWLELDYFDAHLVEGEGDDQLARDMHEQASLFISDLLAQPQAPLVQLLSSSRQPLSQRLADHYGVAAKIGAGFAFVELDPVLYAGVLGQGATLARFRSPSQRGAFIRRQFLGMAVPPPPGDHLFNLLEYEGKTPREQTSNATSQSAPCRACHQLMDPLGFALEAFDDLGRLTGFASSGELSSGTETPQPVNNPVELGKAIASSRAGRLGAALAQLAHLFDRATSSNDEPWAECLLAAFPDGQIELHELARQVALSEAARTMGRPASSVVAASDASDAADPIQHALDETATLLNAFSDVHDRAQLEEYLSALRNLQLMLPI